MSVVIRFNTNRFDVTRERTNPINPIFGESLLRWLKDAKDEKLPIEEPEPEDWGWYAYMKWEGRKVMLGASASDEEGGTREWVLQVVPQRSIKERMLGQGKLTQTHPLVLRLLELLRREKSFITVTVESEA